jgi:DNA-binding MarR family transcriptional regulator
LHAPEVLADVTRGDIAGLTPDEAALLVGARGPAPRARRVLTPEQEKAFAEAYSFLPEREARLARLRQILGDPTIGMGTLKKVQRSLHERGLIALRHGREGQRLARLTPEQEREFAEVYRTIPSEALRLERLRELTGGHGSLTLMRTLQRELAGRGVLDLRPKGGTTSKVRLTPEQERAVALAHASGLSWRQRVERFREIVGRPTASPSTMWVVERDLAGRGLIERRAAGRAPETEEPRFALAAPRSEEPPVSAFRRRARLAAQTLERYSEVRNPAIDELAASNQAKFMREVIEACRS